MLDRVVFVEPLHIIQSERPHTILMVLENTLLLFMTLRNSQGILILHVLLRKKIVVDILLVGINLLKHIGPLDDRFHRFKDLFEVLVSICQLFSFEFKFFVWDLLCGHFSKITKKDITN